MKERNATEITGYSVSYIRESCCAMRFPLSFDQPFALILLPVAWAGFWFVASRSRAPLDRQQRRQSLIVRLILASLIVLAMAHPHWLVQTDRLTVLFLMDQSDSIRPDQRGASNRYVANALKQKASADRAGVIVFGRTPNLETSPSDEIDFTGSHASVDSSATDIQAALTDAAGAFPSDAGKKIVLISDGRENSGDASAEIARLRSEGVAVDVAPVDLSRSAPPEASLDAMKLPEQVQKAAPFTIRLIASTNVAQNAVIALKQDGRLLSTRQIALKPGKNVAAFTVREDAEGAHRYEAVLNAPYDSIPQNNVAVGVVEVRGRPRVLYVADPGSSGAQALKGALKGQGIDVDVIAPPAAPTNVVGWQAYDSVLLSDVPASEFSPVQLQTLHDSVRDFGSGLGMIGGPNSFGAGLYGGTPIETALPVLMRPKNENQVPPVAVVIVLDASGSMSAREDGVEKVQLAAQAAVNLMRSLQPQDQVAVIAVTETPTTVAPLQPASDALKAQSEISSLEAGGGGIYCRTGLAAAYAMLESTRFAVRHVIMCADTTDSEEQGGCVALAAQEYQTNHITTSMLGIGAWGDPHVKFQKAVAAAGHGEMQAIAHAADLPAMFERDVQSMKGAMYIEKPTQVVATPGDPVTAGVAFDTAPPLLGYNVSTAKPDAVVPLRASRSGDVVLAYRQYGLGRTFAFTGDDRAHWAARWLSWPDYSRFWAQAVRWSLKNEAANGLQAAVDNEDGRGHLVVDDLSPSGNYVDGDHLTAAIAAPEGRTTAVNLAQTAPGRYEATFDATDTGLYLASVRDIDRPGVRAAVGLATSYSPEYRNIPPNIPLLTLLSQQTGGVFQQPASRVFRNSKLWAVGEQNLAPGCLLLAAFVLILDIAWRRLGWRLNIARSAPQTASQTDSSGENVVLKQSNFGMIAIPRLPQSAERKAPPPGDYLSRPASSRIGEDDDPFPFVKSKGGE